MSNLTDVLRAKSTNDEGKSYLLKDHILDLLKELEILEKYFDKNEMEYKVPDGTFDALTKAIFLHDLGKIYDNFQWKVFSREEKTQEDWKKVKEFLKGTHTEAEIRHEILSVVWSVALLKNDEWDKRIRSAVLLHHYNDFYMGEKDLMEIVLSHENDIKKYAEFIKKNEKEIGEILVDFLLYFKEKGIPEKYTKIISEMLEDMEFKNIEGLIEKIISHDDDISELGEFYEIKNESSDYVFLVFLGMLRRCDYSASGDVDIESVADVKEVFEGIDERIKKRIGIDSEIWQERLLKKKNGRYLVLVAPTGSGKTEFALLWAKEMGRKFIYTLPLRVALNDIYFRFTHKKEGAGDTKLFDEKMASILHSTAFIEYIKERGDGTDIDTETKVNTSKLFSYPVMLTTPDQVFLTSLNYYGSDKLLSVYPESAVVIDEIQTYNPEMAAIIIRTLEIIKELTGDILIITATFPPYFKRFFDKLGEPPFEIIDVSEEGVSDIKNLSIKRHRISIVDGAIFDSEKQENGEFSVDSKAKEKIENFLKSPGSKMIIVNTVSKAISLYEDLKGEEKDNFYLLHSRIIEKEKSRRIREIKEKMGSGENVVLVSTQIVEASVDLDFDFLITEISTIDSQIQRWGRIYRRRTEDYKEKGPNIIIFADSDRYTNHIYDKEVVAKTVDVLKGVESKPLMYADERKLIEEVFSKQTADGETLKKQYEDKIEKIIDELKYFTVEKKSQAQRLFRDIAGYRVVVPQIMLNSSDEVEKEFAKIVMEGEKKSWKSIIDDEGGLKKIDASIDKWKLKKILYEYSFTMPAYYLGKYRWIVISHEFKGFYVAKLKEEEYQAVEKYGFDKIRHEIEEEMIKDNIL